MKEIDIKSEKKEEKKRTWRFGIKNEEDIENKIKNSKSEKTQEKQKLEKQNINNIYTVKKDETKKETERPFKDKK